MTVSILLHSGHKESPTAPRGDLRRNLAEHLHLGSDMAKLVLRGRSQLEILSIYSSFSFTYWL